MPPVRRSKPTYVLSQVRQFASGALIGPKVIRYAREDCGFETEREVKRYIRECVKALSLRDFAYSEKQDYEERSIFADIYMLANDDGKWFIKFYIDAEQLTILSCHALQWDIELADGRKIKAT